jgi:general secretion pathway protein G
LLLVLAIIGTLTSIGLPRIQETLDRAKIARAIGDIRALQAEITSDPLPADLAAIGRDGMLDPWGNPYVYNPHAYGKGQGEPRKDRFLVPLNSEYDLYSIGKDGQSRAPLTAAVSKDDIVRADDGGYIGLASKY